VRVECDAGDVLCGKCLHFDFSFTLCISLDLEAGFGSELVHRSRSTWLIYEIQHPFASSKLSLVRPLHKLAEFRSQHISFVRSDSEYRGYFVGGNPFKPNINCQPRSARYLLVEAINVYVT